MISKERPRLAEIAEEVADKLIAVHEYRDSAYLRLPVLYPSGSTVVLRLSRERTMTAEPQRFTITDFAAGYDEADMMGTATVFIRHATEIAEREGISWVDHAIVADGLTKEQLFGAAIAVATCSRDAAVVAAERADEGKQTSERDILYRRLTSIFTPSQVHRDVEVVLSLIHI